MEKITVKKLIEFRGKNDRTKITFIRNLYKEKIKTENSSGGDYWISCLSAIRNTFKYNNTNLLDEKIILLQDKVRLENDEKNKKQFQKNLEIVSNFKDYDFQHLRPNSDLTFITQPKYQAIINIKELPIEAKPCHIFTFSNNKSEEIGGIWFVAQIDGFKKTELGMFTDMIYRYLKKYYSKDYYINSDYCIAVDVFNGHEVNYSQIKNGEIPILIESTLDELKKFDN